MSRPEDEGQEVTVLDRAVKGRLVTALSVAALLGVPFGAAGSMDRATPGSAERERSSYGREDLLRVTLPMETSHVFDFIMDPQRLIEKTGAAAYGGDVFEEGATLFFRRSDGRSDADYSSSSDALTIANRGSRPVEVELSANIDPQSVEGLFISDDREFADHIGPGLYLALTDGEQTVPISPGEEISITAVVEETYSFWLTGAVNENGDWSQLTGAAPRVTVTWKVSPWDEVEVREEGNGEEAFDRLGAGEAEGTPGNGKRG